MAKLQYLTPFEVAIELHLLSKEVKHMKKGSFGKEYSKRLTKALKGIEVAVRELDQVSKEHYHA